jgi:hypothetical protein
MSRQNKCRPKLTFSKVLWVKEEEEDSLFKIYNGSETLCLIVAKPNHIPSYLYLVWSRSRVFILGILEWFGDSDRGFLITPQVSPYLRSSTEDVDSLDRCFGPF